MSGPMVILILVSCIACSTGQTFLNRSFSTAYDGPVNAATPVYAALYGLIVSAITLCLTGFHFAPSGTTVLLGCVNGVVLLLYNLGMVRAGRSGPYALQSIVMLFGSIVVCLVFSAFFWGDRMTLPQLAGIGLMLAAFVALNSGGIDLSGIQKGYFFWITLLFFTNGLYGVLMDAQQRISPQQRNEMIIVTFFSSALLSLISLAATQRGQATSAFRMSGAAWGFTVASSVCAAFAVYTLMILLRYIPSYILYTVSNGGVLVLSALLSAVVLKERITGMTLAGVTLSVASIVLLSLP